MDSVIAFGRVLRTLRKGKELTQEQLAFEAGVERNFISLIERGINQPTIRVLFKLATALETSPSEIIRQVEVELDREGLKH